jgi:hypothetical protein
VRALNVARDSSPVVDPRVISESVSRMRDLVENLHSVIEHEATVIRQLKMRVAIQNSRFLLSHMPGHSQTENRERVTPPEAC